MSILSIRISRACEVRGMWNGHVVNNYISKVNKMPCKWTYDGGLSPELKEAIICFFQWYDGNAPERLKYLSLAKLFKYSIIPVEHDHGTCSCKRYLHGSAKLINLCHYCSVNWIQPDASVPNFIWKLFEYNKVFSWRAPGRFLSFLFTYSQKSSGFFHIRKWSRFFSCRLRQYPALQSSLLEPRWHPANIK